MPMFKQEEEEVENGRERSPHRRDSDRQFRSKEEDEYWRKRRERRERLAARGVEEVWGLSPTRDELRRIYEEQEEAARRVAEEARKAEKVEKQRLKEAKKRKRPDDADDSDSSVSSSDSDDRKRKERKRKKKSKKEKKSKAAKKEKRSKKKHKKRRVSSSDDDSSDAEEEKKAPKEPKEEWVEMTRELREEEAQKAREEEAQLIGPQIPDYLLAANQPESAQFFDGKVDAKDRKNMPRSEANAMAAYAAQGKRIPRRGEIGLSSEEISTYEQVGYVMSGTRHKSMEATRLRKENQILTAEEKRLLSGFSSDQRKQKEDAVMQQFQNLISSKRGQ
ncbi:Nkap-C domain-containing protein [Aphelenchoides fujianensis]|nr:Nkap-C domain-containing protein [Aphelenchoides fujianensis]